MLRAWAACSILAVSAWLLYPASPVARRAGSEASVQADLQTYMAARVSSWASRTNFSFGVYSDIHMSEDAGAVITRAQWQGLLTTWRDSSQLFGVIVGDLGYDNTTDRDNVLSGPAAVPSAPPIFYALGNHDGRKQFWLDGLYPGAVQPTSWTPIGPVAPGGADHVYWSFNIGPSTHFIFLDGDYATWDGDKTRYWQTFGQAQRDWLANDIRANADRNICVFVHEPIDQEPTGSWPQLLLNDRGFLLDALSAHPKKTFVFSGHLHNLGGVTKWRGVTSVHVQTGVPVNYGVRVAVAGDTITLSGPGTGTVTDFDASPLNQTINVGGQEVLRVAEDGPTTGRSSVLSLFTGPENGVTPTSGSTMLRGGALTWYSPRDISEHLVKVVPGLKLLYDIYLLGVVGGKDAVALQPGWAMKDGTMPPLIADQNGVSLSRRTKDGMLFGFNNDLPGLGGRATGQWYHREFDLTPMAGNYVDGLYLTSNGPNVNVGGIYIDNIRFTWPPAGAVIPPPRVNVALAANGATVTASSVYTATQSAAQVYAPVQVIDGDRRAWGWGTTAGFGGWADGTANIFPDWLQIDFAGSKTIDEVDVVSIQDAYTVPLDPTPTMTFSLFGVQNFEVQYWTGSTWTAVPGGVITGNSLVLRKITFPALTTSRIRLWITGALNSFSRIAEVEAYARPAGNLSPAVALTSPASGATVAQSAGTTIGANASDSDGSVVSVTFYANGSVIGSDSTTPFSVPWSGAPVGTYSLTAVAIDNLGATTTSSAVSVTVSSSTSSTATFGGTDVATQGGWIGSYGPDGFAVAGDVTSYPAYAAVTFSGKNDYMWASSTTDTRALRRSTGLTRLAATWYGSAFTIDMNLTDGATHQIALYCLDWDNAGRVERIDILDATTLAVLDSRTVSGFNAGIYLKWNLRGHVLVRVTATAGANAVVSGLFFGGGSAPTFGGTDVATQGGWIGSYGPDGFAVAGDVTSYPAYAAVTFSGKNDYMWASSTTDTRALRRSTGLTRLAATWYGSAFTIDMNLTDGATHQVALYCLDWDSAGRVERIDILDATTLAVLDSRTVSGFNAGIYLKWNLRGHVLIRVTALAGANAVVSGLFFGGGS